MLKNIQDGLQAIARQAEETGKAMEGAGKKASTAYPDEMRRSFDRLMPNVGL